jgi:hypothetical protein
MPKLHEPMKSFPIVCVGGSAGWPAVTGVAIVIVNHLILVSTQLHEILPNFTSMPVELISETW